MTSSHCIVILSLIFPLPCISFGQAPTSNNPEIFTLKFPERNQNKQRESGLATPTANLKSWKSQSPSSHKHRLKNAHGLLNILGWGALLPIGAIIARNFRKVPLKCEEWYNLHIVCQTSGYIIGAIGWSFGMWLGTCSNYHHDHRTLKTHRILGIVIFTFATVQMSSALFLQPKREDDDCSRYWEICHQLLGYSLIAIIIANIFEGIYYQPHGEKWRWIYAGFLGILGFVAITLEIFRRFKLRISPPHGILNLSIA